MYNIGESRLCRIAALSSIAYAEGFICGCRWLLVTLIMSVVELSIAAHTGTDIYGIVAPVLISVFVSTVVGAARPLCRSRTSQAVFVGVGAGDDGRKPTANMSASSASSRQHGAMNSFAGWFLTGGILLALYVYSNRICGSTTARGFAVGIARVVALLAVTMMFVYAAMSLGFSRLQMNSTGTVDADNAKYVVCDDGKHSQHKRSYMTVAHAAPVCAFAGSISACAAARRRARASFLARN
jgi:hypothetical protein